MKAEEYYNSLENKKSFTKLTNTGISDNLENVFDFAEAYHKKQSSITAVVQEKPEVCEHTWIHNVHRGTKYCSKGCDGFKVHSKQTSR